MTATASDPRPGSRDRARPAASSPGQADPDRPGAPPTVADRNLQARSNNRVYQAAGNQYIYHRQTPAPAAVSNTLPRDITSFTGRETELRDLVDRVTHAADNGGTVPVHAIDGMPGVGKSALAIRAAHLLEDRFPDGQFFVNLHSHSPDQKPVRPTDALFGLLTADGIEAGQIPADVESRAALWRGRLAGKRALIILDNAAGRDQVEPLLPGAAGCLVLVTSRRRLTGLSARHAAVAVPLGTLAPAQAARLFAARSGRPGTGAEAETIDKLVGLCGHLPLAICLLAAKLRPEPQWRVSDLVEELTRANHRLSHMHAEDVGVAAAFDLSYRRLPASLRRFFRRLGLHPGIDLDPYAAAALDAISPHLAQRRLDALYDDHLLDQPIRGRYRMHDLIRHYARDRAEHDPIRERDEATSRLLNFYQYAAHTAGQQLSRPGRRRSEVPASAPAALPDLHSRQAALAWLDAERSNLFACVAVLSAGQHPRRIIALAAATATYLRHSGPWDHAISLHQAAATAARQSGDRPAHADALRELGALHLLCGNYPSATRALHQSLDLCQQLDDRRGVADTLAQLASLLRRTGDRPGATHLLNRALASYEELADLHGTARALNELGVVYHQNEDHTAGIQAQQRALAIYLELEDRQGQADALNQLGGARQVVSDYRSAIEANRQALDIYRELGDRHGQARALNYLGVALCDTGDYPAAERSLVEALSLHRNLGYRLGEANALNYLGTVRSALGDHPAAEDALSRALALYRDLNYPSGEADALNQLGTLKRLTGQHGAAAALHDEALTIARQIEDPLGQAQVLNQLGQLLLAGGEPAQAREHHRQALVLARQAQNPREEAQSLEGIGHCALSLAEHGPASEDLDRARDIYHRIGALHAAEALAGLTAARVRPDSPG